MPDIEYTVLHGVRKKLKDIGNGTYAEVTAPAGTNFNNKLREAFETFDYSSPNAPWQLTLAPGDIVQVDGNTAGASYLVISKSPLDVGETRVEGRLSFPMPLEVAWGVHRPQAAIGQETALELVNDDGALPTVDDLEIASISQATTVLTVNTILPHGLVPGKRIGIRDCADSRANYAALVVASIPSPTQFTATSLPGAAIPSLTIATQTTGYVYVRPSLGYATDGSSMILETAAATTASYYVRGAGSDSLPSGTIAGSHAVTIATTASVQAVATVGAYAFQPGSEQRATMFIDQVQWTDQTIDGTPQSTARRTVRQVVPSPDKSYKPRIRVTNHPGLTRPVAKIVSVQKTGTTTAIVATDVPHNLTVLDYIQAFGVRDQTNFANLATATVVSAIDSPTVFRVVWGTAVTATSYGGYVSRANGSIGQPGAVAQVIQTATVSGGRLMLMGNTTWAGAVIGDYVNVHGCRDAATGADVGVDGVYRVRDLATTSLVLEPIGTTVLPADFASVNCGGGIIRRTDTRISYIRLLDFERMRVEMMPRPASDMSAAAPVTVQNTVTVSAAAASASAISATTGLGGWYIHPAVTGIADVASAALTTSSTTAAISNNLGNGFQVNVNVSAVTGTTPTLDFRVEESFDGGTNWVTLYEMQRITAVGNYNTPILRASGRHIRYVQTVGGTSPSFTRSVVRNVLPFIPAEPQKRLMDRTIAPNTLNSTTPNLFQGAANNLQIIVNMGAITTTAPAFQVEGSEDGVNWYAVGTPITAVASATVEATVNQSATFARVRVSTAGVGATLGYVSLKAWS